MKINNLSFKNNFNNNVFKKRLKDSFIKKFDKTILDIKKEIKNPNKTLNILDKNFSFNFKKKDLKKFKRYKIISIIGMGGSILGSEALYSFFQTKIKKKVYFFNDLNEDKISDLKKKKTCQKFFL